jgi:UTP:GlnB (protein PII) uridylyltransferase
LSPKFQNIQDTIQKIEANFCCIEELAGIYELETVNEVHSENVSDHTLNVVSNLSTDSDDYYKNLSLEDKNIVKLSAYLHDIGKGPKSKWKDGKQKAYADHPADAIPMIERILSEDIAELTEYEIRKICLLVVYHDLIGDIVGNGRSKKELFDIIQDENELNMLIAISLADVLAIRPDWYINITLSLDDLKEEVLEELSK